LEIDEAIRTYLLTVSGVTSLVGTRILPDELAGGIALPCVIYQKISDTKIHSLTGQLNVERPIYQYTAYATTKSVARSIITQLKTALSDYSGTLSGIVIQKIELQSERSSYQGKDKQSDVMTAYVEDLEYEITFERS
jgi:hypothetical protein